MMKKIVLLFICFLFLSAFAVNSSAGIEIKTCCRVIVNSSNTRLDIDDTNVETSNEDNDITTPLTKEKSQHLFFIFSTGAWKILLNRSFSLFYFL